MNFSEFKNPQKLPIDQLVLDFDGKEKIPALSERWIEKRTCSKYQPIKLRHGEIADSFDLEDEWIDSTKMFNKDLEWMLSMNFHRFWSHVNFDKEFLNPLLSFLQDATPFYLPVRKLLCENEIAMELYDVICRNALKVICRLITNRESDEEFLSKSKHASIVYESFAVTIPMIFDMLAIYGLSNKNLLKKFIDTTIKLEAKYMDDMKMGIKFIVKTFSVLQSRMDEIDKENRDLFDNYEDVSLYLMNISSTLNLIVELFPDELKDFCSHDLRLESTIAQFYESFIPNLYLKSYETDSSAYFLRYINYSRVEFINCYRNLLSNGISSILNSKESNRQKVVDDVLQTYIESAGFRSFIVDYVNLYPIEIDLDVLSQYGADIDKMKLDFVADAFRCERKFNSINNGVHSSNEYQGEEELEGACALPLPQDEKKNENSEEILQIETAKVLELFPDYGTGYIRKLLIFYGYSSEKVIATILEGNLDEMFKNANENEPYIPPETPTFIRTIREISKPGNSEDLIASIQNNEIDVDVKMKGKFLTRQEPKSYHELLNDKSHIQRSRYSQYNMISDENDEESREYDDEYDDSYDDFVSSERKVQMHYSGKMRDMLPDTEELIESEDEESDDEERGRFPPKSNPADFCENPEVIRARREQQYQQRMAKKHGKGHVNPTPPNRDVVGNAKGKGQSDEVLRNRTNKNTNKSTRANHNRKAGASFKQSRGMF